MRKKNSKIKQVQEKQNSFYNETLFFNLFLVWQIQRENSLKTAELTEYFLFPFILLYSFSNIYIKQRILKLRILKWIILQEMARVILVPYLRQ